MTIEVIGFIDCNVIIVENVFSIGAKVKCNNCSSIPLVNELDYKDTYTWKVIYLGGYSLFKASKKFFDKSEKHKKTIFTQLNQFRSSRCSNCRTALAQVEALERK